MSEADPEFDFGFAPEALDAEFDDSSLDFLDEPVTTTMFLGETGGVATDAAAEAYVNFVAVGDTGTTGVGMSVLVELSFFEGGCARIGTPTRADGNGDIDDDEAASPKP